MIRAVVFDVDGVLVKADSGWRLIHTLLGTWDRARVNKELFYKGIISYEEWARRDVSLWRGVEFEKLRKLLSRIELYPGIDFLSRILRDCGVKVMALSAGLDIIVRRVGEAVPFDDYETNVLVVENGVLTGEVEVRVGYGDKGRVFRSLCARNGIGPEECAAVGDSEVDIPMFKEAGVAIAFNPNNRRVVESAHYVVEAADLIPLALLLKRLFHFPKTF